MKRKMSPRLALVIIAAIFVLPLVLAYLMYSGSIEYNPVETRNLGTLLTPPVPVDLAGLETLPNGAQGLGDLEKHWVVLHRLPATCDTSCTEAVTALRQVHRATGRNQSRIRMLLLAPQRDEGLAERLHDIYPAFHLAVAEPQLLRELDGIPSAAGDTYLIDPLGNIMMRYAAGFDPNDLKKDLKRLLTWSKLDEQ